MHRLTLTVLAGACAGILCLGAWGSAPKVPEHAPAPPSISLQKAPRPGVPRFPLPIPRGTSPVSKTLNPATIAAVYAAEPPVVSALHALHTATTTQQLARAWRAYQQANWALGRVVFASLPLHPPRPPIRPIPLPLPSPHPRALQPPTGSHPGHHTPRNRRPVTPHG